MEPLKNFSNGNEAARWNVLKIFQMPYIANKETSWWILMVIIRNFFGNILFNLMILI